MKPVRPIASATLSAAALVALASPASHATVSGSYSSSTQFSFTVTYMPDFDQVRAVGPGVFGLPGDGKQYCVPTSAVNLTAYIAKHGYPFLAPGIQNWQSPSNAVYNDASLAISLMGGLMGTSATGGTGGNAGFAGLQAFVGSPFIFDVDRYYPSGSYAPTTSTIGHVWLNGGVANFCYGRYEHDGIILTDRTSGHCVTATKVAKSGINSSMRYRDPASGGTSQVNQSQFVHTSISAVDRLFFRDGNFRTMSEMITGAGDDILRIIDSVYAIYPISGLTDSPPGVSLIKPLQLSSYNPPQTPFSFNPALIQGLAQSPDNTLAVVLTKALPGALPGKLHKIDPLSESDIVLGLSFNDPLAMCFNRHQELYVIDGRTVICIDVKVGNATTPAVVFPGPDYNAIACDTDGDEVLVLKPGPSAQILKYPRGLTGPPTAISLPTTIPLVGQCWFDCCPEDKSLWMCSEADDNLYQAVIDPASGRYVAGDVISRADIVNPRCIQLRMCDQLIFACDGSVKEFRKTAVRGGLWQEALDGAFKDAVPGKCFHVSRSNTNHDPAIHEPDFDKDTDPSLLFARTEVPDCVGDMNQDGVVNLDDLQEFLFEFGLEGFWRDGDFDQSGVVDLGDLQILLFFFGNVCA